MIRGRYEIHGQLGSGAQGRVFAVRDLAHGRAERVLKVFGRDQSGYALSAFEALTQMAAPELPAIDAFFVINEADAQEFGQAAGRLGFEGRPIRSGQTCLVRERIDGLPADQWAVGRPWEEVSAGLARIARALDQVHRVGFVHGDLKPDNVLVGVDGGPVIIDFGLSRSVTDTGYRGGTPLYLAPEVFRGKPLDQASERYAFGALAYCLAQGHPPFSGDAGEVTRGHLESAVPPFTVDLPARAAALIHQLLDKAPEERPGWDAVIDVFGEGVPHRGAQLVLPFVGRDALLQATQDVLEAGGSRWIVGGAGIGKTRLMQRARWSAERTGLTTIEVPPGSAGLRDKLEAVGRQLSGLSGEPPAPLPRPSGDPTHQRAALAAWLERQLPATPPILFWDDADASPEHLAFVADYSRLGGTLPMLLSAREATRVEGEVVQLTGLPDSALRNALEPMAAALGLSDAGVERAVQAAQGNPRALTNGLSGRDTSSHLAIGATPVLGLLSGVVTPLTALDLAEALGRSVDQVWPDLQEGIAAGQVVALGSGYSLARPVARIRIADGELSKAFARLATRAEGQTQPLVAATCQVMTGRAPSGRVREVLGLLSDAGQAQFAFHLLGAVVEDGGDGFIPDLVGAAEALGRAQEALDYLSTDGSPRHHLARARLSYLLGRTGQARESLDKMLSATLSLSQIAEIATLAAWIALREGQYSEAAERLATAPPAAAVRDPLVAAELATAHAAVSLLTGESDTPDEFRRAVLKLEEGGGMPKLRARLLAFQAMAATRMGNLDNALRIYQQALELVEAAGLDSMLPTFLLNTATAHDHLGQLEQARQLYRRGARLAGGDVPASTRTLLVANQANIGLRLRRFDEVGELIDRARTVLGDDTAGRAGLYVDQLDAELSLHRRDWGRAGDILESLAQRLRDGGDDNALCEVLLLDARRLVRSDQADSAAPLLAEASTLIEERDFSDRQALADVVAGESAAARGNRDAAVAAWTRALHEASRRGDRFRVLEAAEEHAEVAELGADVLDEVQDALLSIVAGLGPGLHSDFIDTLSPALAQLLDAPSSATQPASTRPAQGTVGEEILFRLLALTARLARQADTHRFLDTALEMAIELSGAERGFVLLREDGGFKVAVSRDVDGEPIRRALLKVSRTVADEVAASGEPLVTVDAQHDQRLEVATSVHRLNLTSVMCLPVRTFGRVAAVLYLDHRFREGAFERPLLRLMMAFADQLAVAMVYIDRIRTLERQNVALETAERRVKELLAEQEQINHLLRTRCDTLESDLKAQRKSARLRHRYEAIVAGSTEMLRVLAQVDRLVDSDIPVLIWGESGTGKELVARAIHYNGARRERPFVPINCGAMPENLIESELFGHLKGAFTGANRDHTGLLRSAQGGTIFLDEIGELPLTTQVKLLRVLQERVVRPVGGVQDFPIDVRVVAATNRELTAMVEEGAFRSDLYYRLAGVTLPIPALRKRRADIPLLVQHFLASISKDRGVEITIDQQAARRLYGFEWPGNIRQLENVLRAAATFCEEGRIRPADLESLLRRPRAEAAATKPTARRGPRPKVTSEQLLEALDACSRDVDRVAKRLDVTPRSVYRYLNKYDIAL